MAAAAFMAFFPAVFITVGIVFVFSLIVYVPMTEARRKILQSTDRQFLTDQAIEAEMVKKFPRLYSVKQYAGLLFGAIFVVIYILSFFVIWIFFG